jgi:HPt (histidine-containing phosphotransfer) domain-containing protein/PAS domain-containing protein
MRVAGADVAPRGSSPTDDGVQREGERQTPLRGWSIGSKLAIIVAVVIVAIAVVATIRLSERERHNLVVAKEVGAERVLRLFSLSIYPSLEFEDELGTQEALDRLIRDPEITQAFVWAGDDTAPKVSFAREGEPTAPTRPSSAALEHVETADTIVVRTPIVSDDGATLGHAEVTWSLAREQAAYEDARQLIVNGASAATHALLVLVWAATRIVVVRPLAKLEAAAFALERGEDVILGAPSRDEVGRLSSVFSTMARKILDRERRIFAAHAELEALFDNMRQAIVTIGKDHRLGKSASQAAHRIFGRETLADMDVRDVVLGGLDDSDPERIAFELWLDSALDASKASWDDVASLAPHELSLPGQDGTTLDLRLEFRPFFAAGRVERIMLLATDESDKRRLEREARARQGAHEREMAAMRRIVASGTLPFAAFLRNATARLQRIRELVPPDLDGLRDADLGEMFRHAHTIKGEARTFGLGELEAAAAKLEDTLSRCHKPRSLARGVPLARRPELLGDLDTTSSALEASRRRLVEASPLGDEVLEQVTVSNRDLAQVQQLVGPSHGALRDAVERLASRPFAECIAGLPDSAPTWAASYGKRVRVDVHGGTVRIPASLAEVLRGCMTHLVRNAIAHGIEDEARRVGAGKGWPGVIVLAARSEGGAPVIEVRDDGGGFDLATMARLAGAAGDSLGEDPNEWAFSMGATTRAEVDALAGRGIGLPAVRQDLRRVGFEIEVATTGGGGTVLRVHAKGVRLPPVPPLPTPSADVASQQIKLIGPGGAEI